MNRSGASLLPPMQAGGWMAEENPNVTQSNIDAPLAFSRKPVAAVSVNGQLLGCLQGFLVSRNNESNQSQSGPLSTGYVEQPAVAYAADILMLPEGLRRGASDGIFPQQLQRQESFALESTVEWSKKFSYPLLCSLQQRQVAYMKITVYSAESAKAASSAASKSTKKNIVGTALLDMSPFVDTDDSARILLLPVKGQGQRSGNDICGWLILGLQYFQNKSNTAAGNVSSSAVDDKATLTWANILSDPTIVTAGYEGHRNTDSAVQKSFMMGISSASVFNQPAAPPNPESVALHVAMGELELSMSVAADLKAAKDEVLLVLVRAGVPNELLKRPSTALSRRSNTVRTIATWDNETAAAPSEDQSAGSAIAVINRSTGLPEWDAADITVKCATNKVFTPAVYVSLYRGRRTSSCQIDASSCTFIGESVVTLSRAALMHGAPINTEIPLRDQDGIRVAILQLGAQKTSLLPSMGAPGMGATTTACMRPAPTLLFDRQSMNNISEDAGNFISLSICVEEGSIIDPLWRQPVEPFFEFTLVPPREDMRMPSAAVSRARTGFVSRAAAAATPSSGSSRTRRNNQQAPSDLRLSKANALSASARQVLDGGHSPWGLVCSLLLPRAGFPVGPADEMGKSVWAVTVVCRDAGRAGCPEIASARVGLPWSLLARGRSTDQWLVLFNGLAQGSSTGHGQPGAVSAGMDMVMRSIEAQDSLSSSGRIRLKITSKSMASDSRGLQYTTLGRPGPWTGITALQQFQTQHIGGSDTGAQFTLGHTQVRGASHPGIGASLIWLRGLVNMRSGQEIEPLNITMASATSLVPPIISQSVYGETYYDSADRGDEKERLTFSELVFGRYGNPSKINDDGTRQICDGWGEDWMAGVPGLDGLCGSLPVAGGHSDLRLGISVAHKKVPYSASFSILAGLTACAPPDSEHDIRDPSALSYPTSVQIPALDILVSAHDDDDAAPSNCTGRKAFAQELRVTVRSVPRLKLWTVFVPFVRGRLTVCCRSVRFPLQAQQARRFPDGRAHRCALRFAMSTDSFGYTAAFDIPLDTDTVATMPVIPRYAPVVVVNNGQMQTSKPLSAAQTGVRQPKGGATTAKALLLPTSPGRQRDASAAGADSAGFGFSVTLPIDTLEFTTRGGSCSMLTLQVTLVDLDESGSQYRIGEGGVQTAPLYYQALRAASASPPPTTGPSSFKAAPDAVGVSPWVTSESTLYDRYKQEPAAWVTMSTRFVMEGMSLPVISALQAARHSVESGYGEEDKPVNGRYSAESGNGDANTCNGSEIEELHVMSGSRAVSPYPESTLVNGKAGGGAERRARTELGLKQAFLAADTDHSGSVSVEELLAVIKQSGVKMPTQKPQMLRTRQTRGVVGMEDTVALLLGLAGDTVNMTTMKKHDPLNVTADPGLEQTVRRIFARLDVDGDGMISWWEWQASLSGALLGRHPSEKFIDPVDGLAVIAQAAEDALSARAQTSALSGPESGFPDLWDIPYVDPNGVAKVPLSLSDAGSMTRISQDVTTLRSGGGWGTTGLQGAGAYDGTYRDSSVVAAALKKQLEAETAAEEARMAHRSEKKKRTDLEASLTALKHLNDVVRGARDEKDEASRLLKEKLMADVSSHKDNLDRIVLNKKKRLRASITIALFLKRRVVPRYRRLKLERQRATLGRALLGVFHRKNFLKTMDLRTRATLLLQRRVRGILGRMRLQKLKAAAVKVQRVYRGSRGRDRYQRMLLSRAAGRFSAQFRAAEKLKWALQRFVKRMKAKRHGAAVAIQSAARRKAAFAVLAGKKKEEAIRLQRKKEQEEEAARRHDAACLIGKMARDRVAIRDAKGHRARLLDEREQREAAAAEKRERDAREQIRRSREEMARQESERKAAVAIQAVNRGRMGRSLFGDLKEERNAQQFRLARYQAVARVMRAMQPKPSLRDAGGHWVRFQKKHERAPDDVETAANSPTHSPTAANGHVPAPIIALHSPRSGRTRTVVGPSQPLISPRSKPAVSEPSEGPLLINFRDMSPFPVGHAVEALYGCESEWFLGKVKAIVPVKSKEVANPTQPPSSPRRKKVELAGEEVLEDVLYHIVYDDGDEEICSRGKMRNPETKEKQPGVLAVGQELHAKCAAAKMTLRGKIMGGPYRKSNSGNLAEGAGAGTGGGAGPDDEYDVRFFLDDEKEKFVVEKVKRKHIIAPHLSASLVSELKEREVEKNAVRSRKESLAARQVVVKKAVASPRRVTHANTPRKEGLVSVGVSRGEGPDCGLIGEILRVDKHRRIIHAQLLNLSSLVYYTVELPYDHPRLVWFSYDPNDGDLRDVEEILDLDQTGRPSLEEAANGYYVSYLVEGQVAERCGQVVSVIKEKRTLVTYFQDTINGLVTDITETILYDNPQLSWYKDESKEGVSALSSWVPQPLLKEATGFLVEVRSLEPDAKPGDMFAGEVIAVDEGTMTILVSFDCIGDEEDDEDDVEIIPYNSLDLVWVSPPLCQSSLVPKPLLSQAVGYTVDVFDEVLSNKNGPKEVLRGRVMSVRGSDDTMRVRFKNGNPDEVFPYESLQIAWISGPPPSFLSRSVVPRPLLPQAVGYGVEVRSREDDSDGHAYIGEVVGVNRQANSLQVLFEGGEGAGSEPDLEDITYFSADIAWMKKKGPISSRSLVPRPALADAVGYRVDVKSQEPDHDHDDVFVGEVVSVDVTAGTMRIHFEGQDGEPGDEEEVPYASPDVAWMQRRPAPSAIRSPPGKPIYSRPKGHAVALSPGSAHSPSGDSPPKSQPLNAAARPHTDPAPASPAARVPEAPRPASSDPPQVTVPTPSMMKAVGYTVSSMDLRGQQAVGVVSAVDVPKKSILIRFGERRAMGSRGVIPGSIGTEHYFDFDSPLVAWLKEPEPAGCLLSQSKVPRPPFAQCVGFELGVSSTERDALPETLQVCIVASANPLTRTLHVLTQSRDGSAPREREVLYDSCDVMWRKFPKSEPGAGPPAAAVESKAMVAQLAGRRQEPDSSLAAHDTPGKKRPPLSPQKERRWDAAGSKKPSPLPPLDSAVGFYISVSDADGEIRGKVVGTTRKMLQIKLMDEDEVEDDEVLELQYTSPSIRWYKDWSRGENS